MLSGKLKVSHNSSKNYKIRQIAWITNTLDLSKAELEEMFWPTKEEIERNKKLNKEAKDWLINKR